MKRRNRPLNYFSEDTLEQRAEQGHAYRGHLGRDPELRYTPSGRPVTSFSVATTRNWTNAEGEKRSETEWFNIVAWGSLAEICSQYLKKGQQVHIEGRLQTRRWEDEEGNKRSTTEIVAREMIMLGDRKDRVQGETESPEAEEFFPAGSEEEEFPF